MSKYPYSVSYGDWRCCCCGVALPRTPTLPSAFQQMSGNYVPHVYDLPCGLASLDKRGEKAE